MKFKMKLDEFEVNDEVDLEVTDEFEVQVEAEVEDKV